MQKILKKNKYQRITFKKMEKKRLILKSVINNLFFNKNIRWKTQQFFLNYNQQSSLTRIKNRCILTGRSKSIYRFFKVSRIQLRLLSSKGLLPGMSKVSW